MTTAHLLKKVDLSNTQIEEIQEFTFVHCTSLIEIRLPKTLHTIRVKAFMNCAALPELAIPPSLKYIASRAFLDCAAFKRLVKLPGRHKWRGVYAEENAFAIAQTCNSLWFYRSPSSMGASLSSSPAKQFVPVTTALAVRARSL